MPRPFLTAIWENLVFLNYDCPTALLEPLLPRGTELDVWQGSTLISVVGFMFRDTRVLGIPIPFHRSFEEVNLRFYVKREIGGESHRAVVFVRELVPRRAVAAIARWAYNEPYLAMPMDHRVALDAKGGGSASYGWHHGGQRFEVRAQVDGPAKTGEPGSEAEFITEHYWGYTRQRDGGTLAYRVEHDPWALWVSQEAQFVGPAQVLYGGDFGEVLHAQPRSAYIAVGGRVAVYAGTRVVG